MVGLTLVSELIFEAVKFVVMLGLLVLAVFAGGKIRKGLDAKKANLNRRKNKVQYRGVNELRRLYLDFLRARDI